MSAWRRALGAGLVVAACAAVAIGATAPTSDAPARKPHANVFPDGEGRAIAERTCLICHSAMLVTQQAKDSTAWEKSLAQMAAWGAPPLETAEHDSLRNYLLAKFGPRITASR